MRVVTVSAPSRLHFGFFGIGRQTFPRFGGMGLMIDQPRTVVTVRQNPQLELGGLETETARSVLTKWFEWMKGSHWFEASSGAVSDDGLANVNTVNDLPISLSVDAMPPRHFGLGSGTQLAFSCAMACSIFLGLPVPKPCELAMAVGRGKRSAIGSFGFFDGGLLVDRGLSESDSISPLDFRTDFPADWPILLVMPSLPNQVGLFGTEESLVFENLPDTLFEQREAMIGLINDQLLPGILNRDYDPFAQAAWCFGRTSGEYFRTIQGGPYHGPEVAGLIESIRQLGKVAVSQTSWGPGVFVIARDKDHAEFISSKIKEKFGDQFRMIATEADNRGFTVH